MLSFVFWNQSQRQDRAKCSHRNSAQHPFWSANHYVSSNNRLPRVAEAGFWPSARRPALAPDHRTPRDDNTAVDFHCSKEDSNQCSQLAIINLLLQRPAVQQPDREHPLSLSYAAGEHYSEPLEGRRLEFNRPGIPGRTWFNVQFQFFQLELPLPC